MTDTRSCPQCNGVYPADVAICMRCGIDLRTGQPVQVQVEADDDAGEPSWLVKAPLIFLACFPGLKHPGVLIVSILLGALGVAIMVAGLMMFFLFGTVITAMFMAGAGLVIWAQVAAWMVAGEFGILNDQLADFNGIQWNLFLALALLPVVVMAMLMVQAGKAAAEG